MRGSELFGALKERQFRLLWLGQATSTLGDGLAARLSGEPAEALRG